jgi:predicted membrane protein
LEGRGLPDAVLAYTVPLILTFPGTAVLALAWVAPAVLFSRPGDLGQQVGMVTLWILGLGAAVLCAVTVVRIGKWHSNVQRTNYMMTLTREKGSA